MGGMGGVYIYIYIYIFIISGLLYLLSYIKVLHSPEKLAKLLHSRDGHFSKILYSNVWAHKKQIFDYSFI